MRAQGTGEEVSDEVLVERVRSQIGTLVGHPSSIEVTAANGRVMLSGPILAHEVDGLIERVSSIQGVNGVENRLEVHQEPGNVPGLQGQPAQRRGGGRFELLQTNWSPTARFLVGTAGSVLAVYGARRRGAMGSAIGASGLTLLARAVANMELKRLFGMGAGRRAVNVQKTIPIQAPIERVFELWADYKSFPRFMSHVRSVRDLGDGRSHWTLSGPGGATVEWDAVLTAFTPNQLLAWRTEPGSTIQHGGIVRFQPNPDGGTTVDIKLSYNPAAGALGHMVATLLGADPKAQLDDDLLRMKSYIETGKIPSDAAALQR
jgi:uncharacterized membrane protein